MKKIFSIAATCFIFNCTIHAKSTEHISVKLFISGSLKGEYDFSGPMGMQIKASSDVAEPICSVSSLFRKVKYRKKKSVEAWLTFDCTFEGQKSTYKTHRVYLDVDKIHQKVKLPILAENLKNVELEFQKISLKVSK